MRAALASRYGEPREPAQDIEQQDGAYVDAYGPDAAMIAALVAAAQSLQRRRDARYAVQRDVWELHPRARTRIHEVPQISLGEIQLALIADALAASDATAAAEIRSWGGA